MTEQQIAEPSGAQASAAPADDAYWARIRALVDAAPPLSVEQRAALRLIFHGRTAVRAEAA